MQYDAAVTATAFQTSLNATSLSSTTKAAIADILDLNVADNTVVASTYNNGSFNVVVDAQGNTQTPDIAFFDNLGAAGANVTVVIPTALANASTFVFDTAANVTVAVGTAAAVAPTAAVEGSAATRAIVSGAGNDTITVRDNVNTYIDSGDGNDTIVTAGGNDTIHVGNGTNSVSAGAGNDVITVGNGVHTLDGGAGFDVVNVGVSVGAYTGVTISNGTVSLASATNGNLNLTNVQFVAGTDNQSISIVSTQAEGIALRLFDAVLGRDADVGGAQFYTQQVTGGTSLSTIANNFINSTEYTAVHGSNVSDAQFIQDIYQGALGRTADAEGLVFWGQQLVTGHTRADIVVGIVGSAESQAHDTGVIVVTGQV